MGTGSMLRVPSVKELYVGIDFLQIPSEPCFPSRKLLRNAAFLPARAYLLTARRGESSSSSSNSQHSELWSISLMTRMVAPHSRICSRRYTCMMTLFASRLTCGSSSYEAVNNHEAELSSVVQCADQSRQRISLRSSGRRRGSSTLITNAAVKAATSLPHIKWYSSDAARRVWDNFASPEVHDLSQRAVAMALWCNFLVFCLKCGVWVMTTSHVMLAEAIHSLTDLANQALLAYGLVSSRRAPDEIHPYGYSKERFVWSLISAVGIFCLGSGATIVDGLSSLWRTELPDNMSIAAAVVAGSMVIEGASLIVAISAVRQGAGAEGMTLRDYWWRGNDPTTVAVMMEDGAAVTGLLVAGLSLVAGYLTGNPIYDPIGSILVGNLLGMVAIFLIQRNRHALLGRAMDVQDMKRVLDFLLSDPVVVAVYDCKNEVIGPRSYRFKAEIDFNGIVIVQNYLKGVGRDAWASQLREALNDPDGRALMHVMSNYGENVVTALGSEVDRLEKEIQRLVPGIRHVDIEAHNPKGPFPL